MSAREVSRLQSILMGKEEELRILHQENLVLKTKLDAALEHVQVLLHRVAKAEQAEAKAVAAARKSRVTR